MPNHDLVFMALIVLTIPIAWLLVTWAERNQGKKSALALDCFKNAVGHFMAECVRSRQSGNAALQIESHPGIKRAPTEMHVDPQLGALKRCFRGGIPTAYFLWIGLAATAVLVFVGMAFHMSDSTMTLSVCLVLLLLFCIVWGYLLAVFAMSNDPIILFYERGLILAEKRRFATMRDACQRIAPLSELHDIEVAVHASASRSGSFYWLCQFVFNNQPPFCLKGTDYKSLYQLSRCFSSAFYTRPE